MRSTPQDDAEGLIAAARRALVKQWTPLRWTYWVRLEWRRPISVETASVHLERLIADLQRNGPHGRIHPTIRVVAGFHNQPYPHAHAMLALSRRHRAQFLDAEEFRDWLQLYWYHGAVWATDFDAAKRSPEHGGAIEYLARDPGSVVYG
jgi:hypothetical protein